MVFDRKVRQKYLYFRYAHVSRMPLLTEEDKALYPTYIGLFGSPTVVPDANRISQFIKQHPTQLPPEGCNPNAIFQASNVVAGMHTQGSLLKGGLNPILAIRKFVCIKSSG